MAKTTPTAQPDTDSILIDYKAVCAMLAIGKNSFFKLKQTGRFPIPPIHLGGLVRYDKRQVLRWLDSGCSPAFRSRKGAAR